MKKIIAVIFVLIQYSTSLMAQLSREYRSVINGPWDSAHNWQIKIGDGWYEAESAPNGSETIYITSLITCEGHIISGVTTMYANLIGNYSVASGGVLNVNSNSAMGIVSNNGTVNIEGAFKIDLLTNNASGVINLTGNVGLGGGIIYNYGLLNDVASSFNKIGYVTIYNYNQYNKLGTFISTQQGGIFNSGNLNVSQGTLETSPGTIINLENGVIDINQNAILQAGLIGYITLEPGSKIQGSGFLDIYNRLYVNVANYEFPESITLRALGGVLDGIGGLSIKGKMELNAGLRYIPIVIQETGQLILRDTRIGDKDLTNYGNVIWETGDIWVYGYPFKNYGKFTISNGGNFRILSSYFNTYFENFGTVINNSDKSTFFDVVFFNRESGVIQGSGSIRFSSLQSDGIISPGQSPGILTLQSDLPLLTNSSALNIELVDNSGPGTGYDQLRVLNNLQLNGKLKITAAENLPAGTYTILNSLEGSLSGAFSSIELPVGFTMSNDAKSIIISKQTIDSDADGFPDETDCAPNDGTKWQTGSLFIDKDNDGYDAGKEDVCYGAAIPAGYKTISLGADCNDNALSIHPGATEICGNGIDENCNGMADDVCAPIDSDGDEVPDANDCAPNDGTKWQTASLFIDKDDDGYDAGKENVCYGDNIPDGYKTVTLGSDCDDNNLNIHPGAVETCGNGIDENCNGMEDDVCSVIDTDGDGVADSNDCAPNDGTKWQTASFFIDKDNDGYDAGKEDVCYGAIVPNGYKSVSFGSDCNDNTADVNPGVTEICGNGIDENCNGMADDVCAPIDSDKDGVPDANDCAPNENTKWQSSLLYIDKDNDGYDAGKENVCYGSTVPAGYKITTLGADCDDKNASITLCSNCIARGTSGSKGYIKNVFACYGFNNTTLFTGYGDYTSQSVTSAPDKLLGFAVTPGYPSCYTHSPLYITVYIDWNGDGDFFDEKEFVFAPKYPTSVKSKFYVRVPAGTKAGKKRMRVVMRLDKHSGSCDVFTYGEVEDYSIIILSANTTVREANESAFDEDDDSFKVYPNPASDRMIIERSGYDEKKANSSPAQMLLATVEGKVILKQSLYSLVQAVDVHNVAAGVYFLTIIQNGEKTTSKIIISH